MMSKADTWGAHVGYNLRFLHEQMQQLYHTKLTKTYTHYDIWL